MRDDRKRGEWLCFHANGRLSSRFNYVAGKREGASVFYRESGSLESRNEWRGGMFDGWQRSFDGNGNLEIAQQFRAGKHHGWLRYFDGRGNLIFETHYRNGRRDACVRQREAVALPWSTKCAGIAEEPGQGGGAPDNERPRPEAQDRAAPDGKNDGQESPARP
jgi:hypothetical protein